jgi:hypothetical protein
MPKEGLMETASPLPKISAAVANPRIAAGGIAA